jgi:hypothetical protein
MKAGVAQAAARLGRRFVAGIHDTDYFAKLPRPPKTKERFRAMAHNDTTTKELWSAAAEFSALFGSETVVTREMLQQAGVRLPVLDQARPGLLDAATEAWGWRGVAYLGENPPITAEVPLLTIFPALHQALDWAIDHSLEGLAGEARAAAERSAERMRAEFCAFADTPDIALSEMYRRLAPHVYAFAAGEPVPMETTATTELLRLNRSTAQLPRFRLLDCFLHPTTAETARAAYDEAIRGGSGQYELRRFGTGAIPFDVVIPGRGRGTLRVGRRALVIMTPSPCFVSLRAPLGGVADLAAALEDKFGPNVTVVGKAVTLIGMLAAEFSFVFHEGASGYVSNSRRLHRLLNERGVPVVAHPILRVRYRAWDAIGVSGAWLRLPEPMRRPFGADELCAPSFAARRPQVDEAQRHLLDELSRLRRPIDLIRFLARHLGGSWSAQAARYEEITHGLDATSQQIQGLQATRHRLYATRRGLRHERATAEAAKGRQFRAEVFDRSPTAEALSRRAVLEAEVHRLEAALDRVKSEFRRLRREQNDLVRSEEVQQAHVRRRDIELEAELHRLQLVREAIITSKGLRKANDRPAAWWFPLVSPDGAWFRETIRTAESYWEPLV